MHAADSEIPIVHLFREPINPKFSSFTVVESRLEWRGCLFSLIPHPIQQLTNMNCTALHTTDIRFRNQLIRITNSILLSFVLPPACVTVDNCL